MWKFKWLQKITGQFTEYSVIRSFTALLCSSKCQIPFRKHYKCLRTALHILKTVGGANFSSTMVRELWETWRPFVLKWTLKCCIEWLRHRHLPRILLFGWLSQTCLFRGPRRKWRDLWRMTLGSVIVADMNELRVEEVGSQCMEWNYGWAAGTPRMWALFAEEVLGENMTRHAASVHLDLPWKQIPVKKEVNI